MRTRNYLGLTLIALVMLTPACEYLLNYEPPKSACTPGEAFTLWYNQSAECEDWKVTFKGDIVDSRCPATVTCVWEGRVDVQLEVGDEIISLGLPDDATLGQSKDTVDNRVIELLQVLPAPILPDEIPKETYRARLMVSDL